MPGVVVCIQTFGDLVNFHPHLHCLVTDGCFMVNGWFYVLAEIDVRKLESRLASWRLETAKTF